MCDARAETKRSLRGLMRQMMIMMMIPVEMCACGGGETFFFSLTNESCLLDS